MTGVAAPRAKRRFASTVLLVSSLFASTSHAALVAQSTSTTGLLQYVGFGDIGGGIGSGRYTLGNCAFAAGTTTCTLSGSYVETAPSTHAPGQGGTFTLVTSYPGSGPSPIVAQSVTPGSDVLQFSTAGNAIFTLTLFPAAGGQIAGIYPDPVFANSIVFAAFLDPNNYACTGLSAAQVCGIGQVGLVAGATATGGVNPLEFTVPLEAPPSTPNYEGLWWNNPAGSESGWGINLAHQGDAIFATWFTYDLNGKAWWLSMTANKSAEGTYTGTLYQTNGPALYAVPFTPTQVTLTPMGTGTLMFSSTTAGSFTYTVMGTTQTKQIIPQAFATLPTCVWGAQSDLTTATNYQDLWWAAPAGVESGWGVNLTQQGTTIFATWFTYDANHNPLWYSVTALQTAANTFAGALNRTSGPPFNAVPFDPAQVSLAAIGTATFTFTNGNAGTFVYQVNDGPNVASQTKAITRQVFQVPGTVCH